MSESSHRYRKVVAHRVIEGDGVAPAERRRAAAANEGVDEHRSAFVHKVATAAYAMVDAEVAAVLGAGVSEDEVFELAVCASVGKATRQLDAALAALDEATRT